jgi:hypothetical protein
MANLYAEDEGLTPGSPIVSDVMKKVRAKKRLMDEGGCAGQRCRGAGVTWRDEHEPAEDVEGVGVTRCR